MIEENNFSENQQLGWVKLFRSLIEHQIFLDPNPYLLKYFIYCLCKANHQNRNIIWNKQDFLVERGSFISGLKSEKEKSKIPIQSLRTCRKILCNLKIIKISTVKSTSKFSYVTICNYSLYQDDNLIDQQGKQQASNRVATGKQQASNNKQECKELKERKEESLNISSERLKNIAHEQPVELEGLPLYLADKKLCDQWAELYPALCAAYPAVNIQEKIKALHAWEIANPTKQKKNRARFFNNCLAKEQDKFHSSPPVLNVLSHHPEQPPTKKESIEVIGEYVRLPWSGRLFLTIDGQMWNRWDDGTFHKFRDRFRDGNYYDVKTEEPEKLEEIKKALNGGKENDSGFSKKNIIHARG